ncbi:MAG TPA: hypothetical protein PLX03_05025, partial [Candidatus Hydrogenedentes bacterium]|nr:hypothetical protein [Candidatus Hydrogenedentota bacterium]
LLASPSRQMLIRALTLTREQAVGDGTLESWRAQAEGADLYGGIEGSALKRMGMPLDSISGAVRFEPGHVSARLAVVPDAEWRERLKPFFSRGQNASLKEPPEGCAAISLNLGEPPLKFLQTIRELVPQAAMIPEWLTADTPEMPEDPSEAFFRRFARMLLSETGTSFWLAWLGMDVNEMIPLPIVAGLADQGAEALARMAEEVPGIKSEVSEDPPMIEWTPRAADDGAVYIRLLAGPTLSLCAVPAGDKSIAFGGSLTAARVLAGKEKSSPASSAGNGILMVRVNPGSCLEAVSAAARELAAFGWLKDMPPERLDQTLSVWHAQVGSLREIRFAVATDREDTWQVTGDISW